MLGELRSEVLNFERIWKFDSWKTPITSTSRGVNGEMFVDDFLDFRQHRIHAAHVCPCLSVSPVVIRILPVHETVVVHLVHSGLV